MTHICVGNLTIIGSDKWLVAWSAPSHYLNQCWNIVNWTMRNKLQWNFKQSSTIFIQENEFESVVCQTTAILSRPQCVNPLSKWAVGLPWEHVSPVQLQVFPWTIQQLKKAVHNLVFPDSLVTNQQQMFSQQEVFQHGLHHTHMLHNHKQHLIPWLLIIKDIQLRTSGVKNMNNSWTLVLRAWVYNYKRPLVLRTWTTIVGKGEGEDREEGYETDST